MAIFMVCPCVVERIRFDTLDSMLPIWEILALLLLGFCAGSLGGLLGIGGGVLTIPALSILFGHDIHLAQAASMNVVVFVAIPAAIRHYRQSTLPIGLLRSVIPLGIAGIVLGVLLNNIIPTTPMEKIFGVFLLYVIGVNCRKLVVGKPIGVDAVARNSPSRGAVVGATAGFGAGLLGIGGGLITVPLSQQVCRLTLQHAIAVSACLMSFTSVIGAAVKDSTLHLIADQATGDPLRAFDALQMSFWIIPTAMVGSWMGARLTHILPVRAIRILFIIVMMIGAGKMLWP
tara:strand:+ start:140 stop:1003 length:864 start_codon:yes stop_codon:yes gene_type:complete